MRRTRSTIIAACLFVAVLQINGAASLQKYDVRRVSSFIYVGSIGSSSIYHVAHPQVFDTHHFTTLSMSSSQRVVMKRRPTNKRTAKNRRRKNLQKPPAMEKKVSINEASSMGEAIQLAKSIPDHMYVAEKFIWLPTDDNLPPHLRTQLVHHEKRRRWGGQLLESLGQVASNAWGSNPQEIQRSLFLEGEGHIWTDERLLKIIQSVSIPMVDSIDRPDKEGIYISQALKGLHVLSGCIAPVAPTSAQARKVWIGIHRSVSNLILSADELFSTQNTLLKDAVEVRWAIRGLIVRLQIANIVLTQADEMGTEKETLLFTTPNLNARTAKLPFDILHHCLSWQMDPGTSLDYIGYPTKDLLPEFITSIPFNFDTLTTRSGNSVIERRGTAWLAEEGIGALAYSGKLMRPVPIASSVRETMRDIERWCFMSETSSLSPLCSEQKIGSKLEMVWDDCTSSDLPYTELGQYITNSGDFFDCALCNHYPDGDSACKFHTDPEHGQYWHRVTAVVSCGQSRRFAFRPIPQASIWNEWDIYQHEMNSKDELSCKPAVLNLFPGDVVLMTRNCNDLFHHAVYSSQSPLANPSSSRVSLVFKRALDRNGKKGHGLAGEGRRARRNNSH